MQPAAQMWLQVPHGSWSWANASREGAIWRETSGPSLQPTEKFEQGAPGWTEWVPQPGARRASREKVAAWVSRITHHPPLKVTWKKQHEEGNVYVWQVDAAICTPCAWIILNFSIFREGWWFGPWVLPVYIQTSLQIDRNWEWLSVVMVVHFSAVPKTKNAPIAFPLPPWGWPDDLTTHMSLFSPVAGAPFDCATVFPGVQCTKKKLSALHCYTQW